MSSNALAAPSALTIHQFLKKATPRVAAVIPKHMDADRIVRIALTAMSRNPRLMQCTQESLLLALMEAGQLGLEPSGVMGHAYLVPYKNGRLSKERGHDVYEAQFQIGYRGHINLARRSGEVSKIEARVVREGDDFYYEYGSNPHIRHNPRATFGTAVTHAYAIAWFKDGTTIFEVLPVEEIEKQHRARSLAKDNGPWVTDYEAMCRKTAVRVLAKFLPLTTQAEAAIEMDARRDAGERVRLSEFDSDIEDDGVIGASDSEKLSGADELRQRLAAKNGNGEEVGADAEQTSLVED